MRADLIERANKGLPLSDVLIIDSHAHMGPYSNFHVPFNDPEGMIVSMNALGINTSCVTHHISIGPDFRFGNDLVHKAANDFPGRFIGAICLNPNYPDLIIPEIKRFENSSVMKAIKLHPSVHNYPAGGKAYRTIYEEAAERTLPVTTHTWIGDNRCTPKLYGEIAKEYPDTVFVLIHSGGETKGVCEAIEAAKLSENIYLETCGSMTFGTVERMVEALGSKRVVFGSDMPFIDPAAQLGKVIYAPIPGEAKLDILGRNAKKIFRL